MTITLIDSIIQAILYIIRPIKNFIVSSLGSPADEIFYLGIAGFYMWLLLFYLIKRKNNFLVAGLVSFFSALIFIRII